MTEINSLILQMIQNGSSIEEISAVTHLSHKQVYQRIKNILNLGYSLEPNYHYDGNITYTNFNPLKQTLQNGATIQIKPMEQNFRAIVLSDLHLGSTKDRLDVLFKIYDFCIANNIHIILNTGDFFEGTFGRNGRRHNNLQRQIEYAITSHPFDKNILNFVVLGNHDFSLLKDNFIDVSKYLKATRSDIIPLGFASGTIFIKNDSINLSHTIPSFKAHFNENNSPIILAGHSHKKEVKNIQNRLYVSVPSLSDIFVTPNEFMPSALAINISFSKGLFAAIDIRHLLIDDKIHDIGGDSLRIRSKNEISRISRNLKNKEAKKLVLMPK